MVYDYEIARKVWDSRVPIEFSLDVDDKQARPLYLMVPRVSYLCLQLPKIVQFFCGDSEERIDPDSIWFEYGSQPIKSYYHVGVLYDIHKPKSADFWSISVKIGNKPIGISFKKDAMEQMYLQAVKEADFMKRKAELIYSMKEDEHHQLWNGLVQYNFDEFWAINKRLMQSTVDKPFLNVPLRLYEEGKPFRQLPLKPTDESGEDVTLASAVAQLCPHLDASQHIFISHGISLPLNTPITYLAENLAYPDNFAHICAIPL